MTSSTARLIIASSEICADLYWATRFYVPDPILYFEHRGRKILVASDLEYGRAKKEAEVDQVLSYSDCEKRLKKTGKGKIGEGDVLDFVLRERGIRTLQVPSYFPIRQAEILRKKGYKIEPVPDPFYPEREIKSVEEKKYIIQSLRATEAGIRAAIEVLKKSKIKNGKIYKNGSLLTSEELRKVIEMKMMELGAIGQHTIVACGRQAADPHCRGFGPLYANRPIVLDVFPKSAKTGYHGDITRTVLKGRASEALKKMYAAVKKAQENGIRAIRAGVDASKVHRIVSETLERQGFQTGYVRGKPQGFIHSTGHGLGLDIHEAPRVSRLPNKLRKGNVVTVEPGLYYDDLGGIRIEDVVYVTDRGCEVLTKIPKIFEIP
jgi:Xaa-Pro aminopeptidase